MFGIFVIALLIATLGIHDFSDSDIMFLIMMLIFIIVYILVPGEKK